MKSFYKSDQPKLKSHLQFMTDFQAGYDNMQSKLKKTSEPFLANELRSEQSPNFNSMQDYFYNKGQWAAILDFKNS